MKLIFGMVALASLTLAGCNPKDDWEVIRKKNEMTDVETIAVTQTDPTKFYRITIACNINKDGTVSGSDVWMRATGPMLIPESDYLVVSYRVDGGEILNSGVARVYEREKFVNLAFSNSHRPDLSDLFATASWEKVAIEITSRAPLTIGVFTGFKNSESIMVRDTCPKARDRSKWKT